MDIMNVTPNGEHTVDTEATEIQKTPARRRRPGRPKGSKNRPKFGATPKGAREEGWFTKSGKPFGKARSLAAHRKWQREYVLPQFVLSRTQAQDLLVKFLRSKPGKKALATIISDGFVGLSNMPDNKLGEFLVSTNLLSRYPHEIVVQGA